MPRLAVLQLPTHGRLSPLPLPGLHVVDAAEVVIGEVEHDGGFQIRQFLAESVRRSSNSSRHHKQTKAGRERPALHNLLTNLLDRFGRDPLGNKRFDHVVRLNVAVVRDRNAALHAACDL
jgi:hypothetical protein